MFLSNVVIGHINLDPLEQEVYLPEEMSNLLAGTCEIEGTCLISVPSAGWLPAAGAGALLSMASAFPSEQPPTRFSIDLGPLPES